MGKINERTLKMMEGYEKLWREGNSAPQIAKYYNLAPSTVYKYLGEIAEKIGVTREELLVAPHSEHLTYDREFEEVKPINIAELKESFARTLASMDNTTEEMDVILALYEEEEE